MRVPGAGGGGEGKGGGGEADGSSGEFIGGELGAPVTAPGAALEPHCLLDAARLVISSPYSQTPGWGREEAGAGASHPERARDRGGSGARCVWGWGAAAKGEEGGSGSPSSHCL